MYGKDNIYIRYIYIYTKCIKGDMHSYENFKELSAVHTIIGI